MKIVGFHLVWPADLSADPLSVSGNNQVGAMLRQTNEEILQALNKVYSEAEAEEDKKVRKQGKKRYAGQRKVEKW